MGHDLLGRGKFQQRAFMVCVLLVPEEHYVAFYGVVSDRAGEAAGQRACLEMHAGRGGSSQSI